MALSDRESQKEKKRNVNRGLTSSKARWSDKQKLEAVSTYLVLGNLAQTARLLGIPEITLKVWKASAWWKEVVEDIKMQDRIELSNKLKRIVEAAHQVVENRLVNGDPYIDPKSGAIGFKPVNMRDAHRVAVDLQNQREAVEKATKPAEFRKEDDNNKLQELAEKFAEFATNAISNKHRRANLELVEDVTPKEPHAEMAHDESLSDPILSGQFDGHEEMGEEEQGSPS